MHLDNLRYFYDIATTKNISDVAKKSHISQSALSQQLIKLEDKLDMKLLERSNKGVELTPEGEIVLKYCRAILSNYDNMIEELSSKKYNKKCLNIHSCSYIQSFILPNIIMDIKNSFSDLKISINSVHASSNINFLNTSTFDIFIYCEQIANDALICQELLEDEIIAVCPYDFNIKEEYTFDELSSLPLILVNNFCTICKSFEDKIIELNMKKDKLNIVLSTDSPVVALNTLSSTNAICFIPKLVANKYLSNSQFKQVNIKDFKFNYSLYILVNKAFYSQEKKLIDTLKKKIKGFLK
ncbi:LysR family transcriptional regulator [Clostridium paridis]|uniref:LysR family transcriptional regulator n=1 Tax=Clostridium paridis TaxID=2803863 RepID=A0A937FJ78_9CLOT|nr:LysR family transcriptional regulator [Clostridium paridis]MBL4932716.1 LysR family transcriptional regulator [Clostridium paridis]